MKPNFYTRFRSAVTSLALALLTVILTLGSSSLTSEIHVQVYVDADAVGANNGTSWADAYTDLATAITNTCPGGGEVWVADGTYYPTTMTDRNVSFDLCDDLELYGGFVGTETMLSERDFATNITILSGDIQQNGNSADFSYNVIKAISDGDNARVDGFTVTDGNASLSPGSVQAEGGGLHVENVSLTIANCIFDGLSGSEGGGIYFSSTNAQITNTTVQSSDAVSLGGDCMSPPDRR